MLINNLFVHTTSLSRFFQTYLLTNNSLIQSTKYWLRLLILMRWACIRWPKRWRGRWLWERYRFPPRRTFRRIFAYWAIFLLWRCRSPWSRRAWKTTDWHFLLKLTWRRPSRFLRVFLFLSSLLFRGFTWRIIMFCLFLSWLTWTLFSFFRRAFFFLFWALFFFGGFWLLFLNW